MTGKCIKYGDMVSTDLIIAGKYTKTLDVNAMASHAMEDNDPTFIEKVKNGRSFIVAGSSFGCGSSREQAPLVLKISGVKCIVAKSFARIFFRNAVNLGIPIVECDTDKIDDGDDLVYDIGSSVLENRTKNEKYSVKSLPKLMVDILSAGGVVNYYKH